MGKAEAEAPEIRLLAPYGRVTQFMYEKRGSMYLTLGSRTRADRYLTLIEYSTKT